MHIFEFIRRSCEYQMPKLGFSANRIFQFLRPHHIRSEVVKGVFVNLDLNDETANNIFYLGRRYEQPTLSILQSWIDKGASHFFDIGANFGYFSLALLAQNPTLKALAFEPHPTTFQRLRDIVVENHITRLECLQLAISSQRKSVPFYFDAQNSGASRIVTDSTDDLRGLDIVDAAPLDEILQDLNLEGISGVAKIDVEGHELAVLQGMATVLKQRALVGVCIEINADSLARTGTTPESIHSFLNEYGYRAMHSPEIEFGHRRRFTDNWFYERE